MFHEYNGFNCIREMYWIDIKQMNEFGSVHLLKVFDEII